MKAIWIRQKLIFLAVFGVIVLAALAGAPWEGPYADWLIGALAGAYLPLLYCFAQPGKPRFNALGFPPYAAVVLLLLLFFARARANNVSSALTFAMGTHEAASLLGFGLSAFLFVPKTEGKLFCLLRPLIFLAMTLLLACAFTALARIGFRNTQSQPAMRAAGLALLCLPMLCGLGPRTKEIQTDRRLGVFLGALALCAGALYLGAQAFDRLGTGAVNDLFLGINGLVLRSRPGALAASGLILLLFLQLKLSVQAFFTH